MNAMPQPVVCQPLFKAKPWGGRALAEQFGKALPPQTPIGESWELVSLPENESVVRDGLLTGTPLSVLLEAWGGELLGGAALADGRFPLLIKFLDAQEHLSVQVHPKPIDERGWSPGIKHEAWYILHAEPGAELFIDFKPGVTPADVAGASNTPAFADLLQRHMARVGDCYYLPSGTMHALGAGIVVAEVQTPSDVTYRIYDWERIGLDGRPRELHLDAAQANARYDVAADEVLQPRRMIESEIGSGERVAACHAFTLDRIAVPRGSVTRLRPGRMRIWMVLDGAGVLVTGAARCAFGKGDTVLVPAACAATEFMVDGPLTLLEAGIPD